MLSLAPIVLFVYNRPDHVLKTLSALKENTLSGQSKLIIYCDGPKQNLSEGGVSKISSVRKVIRTAQWCKDVEIIERTENYGLSKSIITGVSEVVKKYGKVIVLEDDIITTKGFLKYMNDSLSKYESTPRVMHVSAYSYPINYEFQNETFFLDLGTCWGWGTWAIEWELFEVSTQKILSRLEKLSKSQISEFDKKNNFFRQLKRTHNGEIDSWAIRWYSSIFINNGLSLHPFQSLVKNIGFDGSGTHKFDNKRSRGTLTDFVSVKNIEIEKSIEINNYLKKYFFLQRVYAAPRHYMAKVKRFLSTLFSSNL